MFVDKLANSAAKKMSYTTPLDHEKMDKWRQSFYQQPKNVLAQNVCSRNDPIDVCMSRSVLETTNHYFTHKLETEGKPVTNQKSSGRCWLFAALNCMRIPMMKEYNLDEFELSQAYLFYCDKIERCNYFLNNIVETYKRGEKTDGRLLSFLLFDPVSDGGQWDMIVNLVTKYGLMPKKSFPESFNSEASARMNVVIRSKLRENTKILRDLMDTNPDEKLVQETIDSMMADIYKIVGICMGIPPKEFVWEYYDKSKAYHSVGPITPQEFYNTIVKPLFNVENKACLVTDPRPTNKYGQAYTVDCLGNVVGGRPVLYNNQPVDVLLDLVAASIKANEPVWFGCEVNKCFARKQGIEDLNIFDYKVLFDVDSRKPLSKADRLTYGESSMTHAMVFTAVSLDDKGKVTKLRVENSWGEDRGEKGYLVMTADWFREFGFEVVVDKKHVPEDILKVFDMDPILLPAWDPMGTLANSKDNNADE